MPLKIDRSIYFSYRLIGERVCVNELKMRLSNLREILKTREYFSPFKERSWTRSRRLRQISREAFVSKLRKSD